MTASTQFCMVLLAVLGWIAVCADLLFRRIPNALVLSGMALGLVIQSIGPAGEGLFSASGDGLGLGRALLGGVGGLLLFLPMVTLRAMGAGDAKLLAMAGVWLGLEHVAYAALWTLVAGGVLALGAALYGRVLRRVLANVVNGLMPVVAHRLHFRHTGEAPAAFVPTGRLPYAVAIVAGTAFELMRMMALLR
jgi:prepilin peptidase CpaA